MVPTRTGGTKPGFDAHAMAREAVAPRGGSDGGDGQVEHADEAARAAPVKAGFRGVTDNAGGCAERTDGRSRTREPKPVLDSWPSER